MPRLTPFQALARGVGMAGPGRAESEGGGAMPMPGYRPMQTGGQLPPQQAQPPIQTKPMQLGSPMTASSQPPMAGGFAPQTGGELPPQAYAGPVLGGGLPPMAYQMQTGGQLPPMRAGSAYSGHLMPRFQEEGRQSFHPFNPFAFR